MYLQEGASGEGEKRVCAWVVGASGMRTGVLEESDGKAAQRENRKELCPQYAARGQRQSRWQEGERKLLVSGSLAATGFWSFFLHCWLARVIWLPLQEPSPGRLSSGLSRKSICFKSRYSYFIWSVKQCFCEALRQFENLCNWIDFVKTLFFSNTFLKFFFLTYFHSFIFPPVRKYIFCSPAHLSPPLPPGK